MTVSRRPAKLPLTLMLDTAPAALYYHVRLW